MNDSPLISVIIPAYNIAPYVEKCISTVLMQTYSKIELLLVDDGSTDNTGKILDYLAETDKRIRVIHQVNGGVTKARLTGVEAAKGEWIGFVDGDDVIEPEMYEHLLTNAIKYKADISHCGYQMVFPSRVDFYYNTGSVIKQDKQSGLKDLIEGTKIEPGLVIKLFRKDLFNNLLQNRLMDLSIRNNEDLLMNFYLFREANNAIYEDFCPYHYLVRKGSAATAKINEHKLRDPLTVLKIIKKEAVNNPELQNVVNSRIAGVLVGLATMESDNQKELIIPYQAQAREELLRILPEIWKGKYSKRTKTLSTWAAIWPGSYSAIHKAYAKIRGSDKKYEVG